MPHAHTSPVGSNRAENKWCVWGWAFRLVYAQLAVWVLISSRISSCGDERRDWIRGYRLWCCYCLWSRRGLTVLSSSEALHSIVRTTQKWIWNARLAPLMRLTHCWYWWSIPPSSGGAFVSIHFSYPTYSHSFTLKTSILSVWGTLTQSQALCEMRWEVANLVKACGIPGSPPIIHEAFHAAGLGRYHPRYKPFLRQKMKDDRLVLCLWNETWTLHSREDNILNIDGLHYLVRSKNLAKEFSYLKCPER